MLLTRDLMSWDLEFGIWVPGIIFPVDTRDPEGERFLAAAVCRLGGVS